MQVFTIGVVDRAAWGGSCTPQHWKSLPKSAIIDDYAQDGGEELSTKMLCVLIANP